MNSRFLDAGYVIALEVLDDQHHQDAQRYWKTLLKEENISLVTTSYVISEVVTFLNTKQQHSKALRVGNNLLTSAPIHVVHVDEALFYQGWEYFGQHQDKTLSLTDCISFVLMKKLGIREALSFDRHFVQGFIKLP